MQNKFLPYITDPKIDDSYMKRVGVNNAEIGSRPSNMPDFGNSNSIKHVGDSVGGTTSDRSSK